MALIHLIRHARPATAWGDSDPDPGLDAVGAAQAQAVARRLLALPADERPVGVVSSPLRRCRETARPLAEALGVTVDIELGVGEIPTPAALETSARGSWLRRAMAGRWAEIAGDLDYEGWRRAVLAVVVARPSWAVFSHFVAINAVVSLLSASDQVMVFRPDHASVTTLAIDAGGPRLVSLGQAAATGVL